MARRNCYYVAGSAASGAVRIRRSEVRAPTLSLGVADRVRLITRRRLTDITTSDFWIGVER